jgi:hypothetical protein
MGELKSISHLSKYGRPLYAVLVFYGEGYSFYIRWHAQHLADEKLNVVDLASLKFMNGSIFYPANEDHVLAVLSQRLCIDLVLASSEAIALADRSVTYHMRILTGISEADGQTFYTYSPSEPLLALGAIKILYDESDTGLWAKILDTFNHRLCSAGLVEKGLLGELASRILFIIARDFAAPYKGGEGRNLLEPVLLLRLIDKLFGNTTWCSPKERTLFAAAFGNTYVNYTHIIVTKDSLPDNPSR